LETRYLLLASQNISSQYEIKLDFSQRLAIGLTQFPDIGFQSACLECSNGDIDCLISVNQCFSTQSQYWAVDIKQNQIDWNDRKIYFSIYSKIYPKKCLTVVAGNGNEYKLKIEDSYLKKFAIFLKEIVSYISLQVLKLFKLNTIKSDSVVEKSPEIEKIFVFKLMDCNANNKQSFYFDEEYEHFFDQFNDFNINMNHEEL